MKYIKPEAEIVDLENEDIIVASLRSNICSKEGIIDKPNDPRAMGCNFISGDLAYNGVCGALINGITCSLITSSGRSICAGGAQGNTRYCTITAGGN